MKKTPFFSNGVVILKCYFMQLHICPQSSKTQSMMDSMHILQMSDSSAVLFCLFSVLALTHVASKLVSFERLLAPFDLESFSFSSCSKRLFSLSDLYRRLTLSMSSCFTGTNPWLYGINRSSHFVADCSIKHGSEFFII